MKSRLLVLIITLNFLIGCVTGWGLRDIKDTNAIDKDIVSLENKIDGLLFESEIDLLISKYNLEVAKKRLEDYKSNR